MKQCLEKSDSQRLLTKCITPNLNILMSNVYIVHLPDGKFGIRTNGAVVLRTATQGEAIALSARIYPNTKPDIERVRDTSKGKRDKWR
jgi:hypothetical protein